MHYVDRSTEGALTIVTAGDISATSAREHITDEKGKLTLLFVRKTVYEEGNVRGLEVLAGLTSQQAKRYAGTWISISRGEPGYDPSVFPGELTSYFQSGMPTGKLSSFTTTIRGTRVIGVAGVSRETGRRFLRRVVAPATGKPVPLVETLRSPGTQAVGTPAVDDHRLFSKWNQSVNVVAPAQSVPITTVLAG
jgi:hypothetical protein